MKLVADECSKISRVIALSSKTLVLILRSYTFLSFGKDFYLTFRPDFFVVTNSRYAPIDQKQRVVFSGHPYCQKHDLNENF